MKAKFGLMVRGDGTAYVQVVMTDLPSGAAYTVWPEAMLDNGVVVPCALIERDERGVFVLALPLMDTKKWRVRFSCINGDTILDRTRMSSLSAVKLKWKSRLNYRLHPALAESIRDADVNPAKRFSARFLHVVPDGEELVVHANIKGPEEGFSEMRWTSSDLRGSACDLDALVMERGHDVAPDGARLAFLILSFRIPKRMQGFCLKVSSPAEDDVLDGFGVLDTSGSQIMQETFLSETRSAANDPNYNAWFRKTAATDRQLKAQAKEALPLMPCFSIVVPLYNTPETFLREMLESVKAQSYGNWQLVLVDASPQNAEMNAQISALDDSRIVIVTVSENKGIVGNTNEGIAAAAGDFICFLDHDDTIAPNTLFEYAKAVNACPETDVLYCDEDRFDSKGRHFVPFFKPDYSPHLLRVHNYVTHFLAIRASVIDRIGVTDVRYEGAQDYDLTLRATRVARKVSHVPHVLYHWRLHDQSTSVNPESKIDYAKEAGRLAVQHHLDALGIAATVHNTELPFAYRPEYDLPRPLPKVSIVIPSKDHIDVLDTCLQSLLRNSTYENFEIIVVENNSVLPETQRYYTQIQQQDERVKVITWEYEFNFSKIVNFGAKAMQGDYLLLLNNDTQVIAADFLQTMVALAQQKDVGVVGAKLLYSDNLIQHAGVRIGADGAAAHLFVNLPAEEAGYFDHAIFTQDLSAVTGACQMMRRSVWEELGGYCEDFTVGYNDVDFCLRVRRAGYYVVYEPAALLYHHEFASRERDVAPDRRERVERETQLLRSRWPEYFAEGDPFGNPNFDVESVYCALGDSACAVRSASDGSASA